MAEAAALKDDLEAAPVVDTGGEASATEAPVLAEADPPSSTEPADSLDSLFEQYDNGVGNGAGNGAAADLTSDYTDDELAQLLESVRTL